MKIVKTILFAIIVCLISCNKGKKMTLSFDMLSINLPESFNVTKIKNKDGFQEWKINNNNDTFYLQQYCNEQASMDSLGYNTKNSLSLYDDYLNLNLNENKLYEIEYLKIGGFDFRIVKRLLNAKYFIEIGSKEICNKKCIIQIIGVNLTESTFTELLSSVKTIRFNCK